MTSILSIGFAYNVHATNNNQNEDSEEIDAEEVEHHNLDRKKKKGNRGNEVHTTKGSDDDIILDLDES